MPVPLPFSDTLRDFGKPKINRAPSPTLVFAVPWLLVMLFSLAPSLPLIASAPLLPPLGFMALLAWQQLRPGLFPVWAGLPLGLFDDLYSGQPVGSAVVLWSLAMIGLDVVERRFPWRGFAHNWLVASAIIAGYLVLALGLANMTGGSTPLQAILPQIGLSIMAFPIVARAVGGGDRLRLIPVRTL